jgi:hypothetical protein
MIGAKLPRDGERQRLAERRQHRQRDIRYQQRVAVGHRLRHSVGADDAAAARPRLDDEALAPPLGQSVGDDTRNQIVAASGRVLIDELDQAVRVRVRLGHSNTGEHSGANRQDERDRGQHQGNPSCTCRRTRRVRAFPSE